MPYGKSNRRAIQYRYILGTYRSAYHYRDTSGTRSRS